MTNHPDARMETLRGRRGCLIWFLVLLVATAIGAAYTYRQELAVHGIAQDGVGAIVAIWNDLTGATPTPATNYEAVVTAYRQAEAALLKSTLNDEVYTSVLDQLHIYTAGEALTQLQATSQLLRTNNRYQIKSLDNLEIVLAVAESPVIKLLTKERHHIETFERQASGNVLVESTDEDVQGVYQIIPNGNRWLVEKAVRVDASNP